jgi:hypothetical protein
MTFTVTPGLRGRLHGAFSMCVFMSGEPFDAEACNIGGQASATNGSPDMKTHIGNAACNRPLIRQVNLARWVKFHMDVIQCGNLTLWLESNTFSLKASN